MLRKKVKWLYYGSLNYYNRLFPFEHTLVNFINFIYLKFKFNRSNSIAVYIELPMSYNYLEETIKELQKKFVISVFYHGKNKLVYSNRIGIANLYHFSILRSIPYKLIITPETGNGAINAKHHSSKIVNLMHSLVSTHVIYPDNMFTKFDYVLCSGPHHRVELEAQNKYYQAKTILFDGGYEPIDRLANHFGNEEKEFSKVSKILFAPSWGPENLLRKLGIELINTCLNSGYEICLRPHPMSFKFDKDILDEIEIRFSSNRCFRIDRSAEPYDLLLNSDVLISDYSGIAFEFSLGLERPVIFIEAPRKVFNKEWKKYLAFEGVEVVYRNKIGYLTDKLSEVFNILKKIPSDWEDKRNKISIYRNELLFNYKKSASKNAIIIEDIMKNL